MATYDSDLIEIDIEDLMGLMEFEKPVLRSAVTDGVLRDISDDVLVIESFTSTGIVMPLVYGVGVLDEIDIEELFVAPGMSYEKPVLWQAVGAGILAEIKLGGPLPLVGDTLRLIDFENNKTHTVVIEKGLIKSWDTEEVGDPPNTPNSHSVVISKGLIQSWNISAGGTRVGSIGHSVDILKGLVQTWSIT